MQEVLRIRNILLALTCREELNVKENIQSITRALEELREYPVDREVLARTSIGKEVTALKSRLPPLGAAEVVPIAEALLMEWKRDHRVREQVVEGFAEKGLLSKRTAREVEEGLFAVACPSGILEGEGYRCYQRNYKRLCTHLRTRGAGSLAQRIGDGELAPSEIARLPDGQLLSQDRMRQQQLVEQDCLKSALAAETGPAGIETQEYICPSCGSTSCSYVELTTAHHTDGQDSTILVSCLSCRARWKAQDDHGFGG